jgi:hypothetical protein
MVPGHAGTTMRNYPHGTTWKSCPTDSFVTAAVIPHPPRHRSSRRAIRTRTPSRGRSVMVTHGTTG